MDQLQLGFFFFGLFVFFFRLGGAKITTMYIMGDSLVDAGNNNYLPTATTARGNFLPYGRDFQGGPNATGRFTNSYLASDFIAAHLRIPLARPYLQPTQSVKGSINFASAGTGLYHTTGDIYVLVPNMGYPRPMSLQVENFITVKNKLINELGQSTAIESINNALFYITFGSNDIANNYYHNDSSLQSQFTISQFIDVLIQIYQDQIEILFQQGARKFVIASLFPLGCSPLYLINYKISQPGRCQDMFNAAAWEFNCKLENAIVDLRCRLSGTNILLADSYDLPLDIVQHPASYDLVVPNVGCCNFIGPGKNDNGIVVYCLPASLSCVDASKYVYWDQVHPTSKVYGILANFFFNGSCAFIRPININHLSSI